MRFCSPSRRSGSSAQGAESGYVLITLILFVALLAIALTALAPVITQQIKRDREEELIHRGTQYSRAIKHYMKKFSKYPTSIDDLESTNNIRYLRKRYKDPLTGKDFKLLHMSDVQMSSGSGLVGANSAAGLAAASGGNAAAGGNTSAFGGSGVFGGGNSGSAFGGNSGGGFGGNSGGGFGGNSGGGFGGNTGQTSNNNPATGSDPNQPQGAAGAPQGQGGFGQSVQNLSGSNSQGSGNQVVGGGPVIGVASINKDKSIRSFSKKDHYNEWQFVYDPTTDRGGLITTPYQNPIQTGIQSASGTSGTNGTPGAPGTQGAPASPFGFGGGQPNAPGGFGGQQPQTPQTPTGQGPQ